MVAEAQDVAWAEQGAKGVSEDAKKLVSYYEDEEEKDLVGWCRLTVSNPC
jgi:hypothetical protein